MFKKLAISSVFFTVILGLSGCAGVSHMQLVPSEDLGQQIYQKFETMPKDHAVVVFFRPDAFAGAALNPGLFDFTDPDNPKLVGILSSGTKVQYFTTPGKHEYFWTSSSITGPLASKVLKADLQPGKIYYVQVFRPLAFVPIKDIQNKKFIEEYNSSKWVRNTAESLQWFESVREHVKSKFQLAYSETPDNGFILPDGSPMAILPEYGFDTFLEEKP